MPTPVVSPALIVPLDVALRPVDDDCVAVVMVALTLTVVASAFVMVTFAAVAVAA